MNKIIKQMFGIFKYESLNVINNLNANVKYTNNLHENESKSMNTNGILFAGSNVSIS